MKIVSEMLIKMKNEMQNTAPIVCTHVSTPWGPKALKEPIISTDHTCEYCGGAAHGQPLLNPGSGTNERLWSCFNGDCSVNKNANHQNHGNIPTVVKRAIEWPLFCEINGIGSVHHDVKFEKIHQSAGKLEYLTKFVKTPFSFILMSGASGTGKSYCAMAVCEAITKNNPSCLFITQKQLFGKYMEHFSRNPSHEFCRKLENVNCLVVDDFGTGEISPGFMSFFMDLMNTRMQWKDRGTIVTTNLEDKKMEEYCGEALWDRFCTGMTFQFEKNTRRNKSIL